ncbi:MAG: hypothetical protein B6U75_00695 [Desulfurococcales archaeon ex4484_217_1]|nr:MAG: hypothetical protein B6U75_00695 [Desulfurococcales archaeon ex4484_217_1]
MRLIPEAMRPEVAKAKEILKKANMVTLVYHDDADGVCSAALAMLGLNKLRVNIRRKICLEKLFPQAIKAIHSEQAENDVVLYVDLGSPHVDKVIREIKNEKVIIIDHHDPKRITSENVIHINPELYGLTGERDAEYVNKVRVLRSRKTVRYYVDFHGLRKPHTALSSMLSTMASIGYYNGGPEKAVRSCIEGFSEDILKFHDRMKALKSELFKKAYDKVYAHGLSMGKYVQWFDIGDLFYNIGVKSIGLFTSQLKYRRIVDQEKYLLGFMKMNPNIPGLGKLEGDFVKVSGRTPPALDEKVRKGTMPGLGKIMTEAAEEVGGFADGHDFAASGIIGANRILAFIEKFEEKVEEKIERKGLFKYFIK